MINFIKPTNFLLTSALAILIYPASLSGQEISVRSMCLSKGGMPELFFKTNGDIKLSPVNWSRRQPSKTIKALHDGSLPLYKREKKEDGEIKTVLARRVKIPPHAKEILLFGALSGDELRFFAIPDNFLTAKYNNWLLVNLSSKTIDFKVGEKTNPVRINSGQSRLYKINVAANKGASVLGRASIKGKLMHFYSTYLPVRERDRTIILFSDDGDKIRTKPIYDKFIRRETPSE